jgi:hypothetical protein
MLTNGPTYVEIVFDDFTVTFIVLSPAQHVCPRNGVKNVGPNLVVACLYVFLMGDLGRFR